MQNKDILPAGSVIFKDFPEKVLLQGKSYPITILLKNRSEQKEIPVDFYLKYRVNGFKIIELPENLKSGVWFSMPYNLEYSFSVIIEPTIEGPLQFEINMFGKKVIYSQVKKTRKIEQEVEKGNRSATGEVQVLHKKEKYIEEKIDLEEILLDSTAIYMEAINAGQSANLENFMTLGDVSSNIDQITTSTIIFYFPTIVKPEDKDLLRLINKQMFQTSGKSFIYLNYPITQKLNESEMKSISEGIRKFFPKIQHLDSKLIFNLDFIPKFEKPTIIIGKDNNRKAQEIQNALINKFGNNFNIVLDSNIFQGGSLFEHLNALCTGANVELINLVLSEHFKEDYNLFIEFLNIFSRK